MPKGNFKDGSEFCEGMLNKHVLGAFSPTLEAYSVAFCTPEPFDLKLLFRDQSLLLHIG